MSGEIKSMKEAIDTVDKSMERLWFMTRATEHEEFDNCDAKVLTDYLSNIAEDLSNIVVFLQKQEAPATTPASAEVGA